MKRIAFVITAILSIAAVADAADHTVTVGNNFFSPRDLTIQQGDTVTWTNDSGGIHNVHADDDSFRCANSCSGSGGDPSADVWTVTLQFDDPGMIAYYCDLHGAPNGLGMAGTITVEEGEDDPLPEENFVFYLPVAGSVQGQAFFRTNARLFNPSDTDSINVAVSFLPRGQSNESPQTVVVTLSPLETIIYENVVESLLDEDGLGAIRLHSDLPFIVTSRILTDSVCEEPATGGTFGQFVTPTALDEAGTSGVIPNLTVNESFRSNIGFLNPGTSTVGISVTLHGPAGQIGSAESVNLENKESIGPVSVRSLFNQDELNEEALWVRFESADPVIAYGSMVDNGTNDQIFISSFAIESTTSGAAGRSER